MKNLSRGADGVLIILLLSLALAGGGHGLPFNPRHPSFQGQWDIKDQNRIYEAPKENKKQELGMELFPTGSSLPDCSHACGPCVPCKRVMVSFKCSMESCPVVYRCMCKGKYYQVPSH